MRAIGLLLAGVLLTGCPGTGPSEEEGTLTFFNWWTSPGERAALEQMTALYTQKYPDVLVENAAVTGAAGVNLRERLYDQGLRAGNPPDSYQIHIGAETKADLEFLEKVDELYTANGWSSVFPAAVLSAVRFDGSHYTVPVNVHRSNVLWYRKDLLAAVNKQPPTTWVQFFEVADALKAAGHEAFVFNPARDAANPSNRSSWTAGHILESILLAELGQDNWNGLFAGNKPWNSAEVREAFSKLRKLVTYAKAGVADTGGYDIKQMTVATKPAAMGIMGDWAEGDLKAAGWKPGVEFGWVAAPGTGDYFMFLSDAFTLPKGAKHPKNARRWLELVGSKEAQDAFNPVKGSIPARLDADASKYDAYLATAIADFKSKKLVPSLAHGAAAPPGFKDKYFDIVGKFLDDGSPSAIDTAVAALASACELGCR
jgi:glucose/mannose transport system substrate-binding protein